MNTRAWPFLVLALLSPAPALAQEVLTESFDDPFEDWFGRWLRQNSNLNSYYRASNANDLSRGNQPFGTWISDDPDGQLVTSDPVVINFLGDFGETITELQLNVAACHGSSELHVFDYDGNLIFDSGFIESACYLTGITQVVTSDNGVSRFEIHGNVDCRRRGDRDARHAVRRRRPGRRRRVRRRQPRRRGRLLAQLPVRGVRGRVRGGRRGV
jgi:hypothetical protein